jgi:hypothetical protein
MKSKTLAICLWFIVWGTGHPFASNLQLVWKYARTPDGLNGIYTVRMDDQTASMTQKRLVAASNESRLTVIPAHGRAIHYIESSQNLQDTTGPKPKIMLSENSQKRDLIREADFHGKGAVGIPLDGAISHSGRYMVFTVTQLVPFTTPRGDHFKEFESRAVCVMDLYSGQVREVVPAGYWCESPVFSPDDTMIAFYRAPLDMLQQPGNGNSNDAFGHRLCVVPVGAGEVQVLSPPPNTIFRGLGDNNPPSWSPDGKKILFVAQYNDPKIELKPYDIKNPDPAAVAAYRSMIPMGIYMVDLSTRKMERLTPAEWGKGAMCPSWAPDGKRFVCILRGELAIVDRETKALTPVGHKAMVRCKWAPRGDLIAFDEQLGPSDTTLSVIASDGKHYTIVKRGVLHLQHFFWCE